MRHVLFFSCLFFLVSGTFGQNIRVGSQSLFVNDSSRDARLVTAQLFYPIDQLGEIEEGPFPIIVFAHGMQMSYTEYDYMWRIMVPFGYIVAFPTTEMHLDPNEAELGLDMLHIIDALQEQGRTPGAEFEGKIGDKAIVMGHDFGAASSVFAAAQGHPSLVAMANLAFIDSAQKAINAAPDIQVPSLIIGTNTDCLAKPIEHQIPLYESISQSAYKVYLDIHKGTHCQFGRALNNSPCRKREKASCLVPAGLLNKHQQQDHVMQAILPWCEYYLKAECAAWQQFYDFLTDAPGHTYETEGIWPAPIAQFTSDVTGRVVRFSDFSNAAEETFWNFGDGDTSTELDPVHVFSEEKGNVQLVVTAANSCKDTAYQTFTGMEPVAWLGFEGHSNGQIIELGWSTATESFNEGFVIQRSSDGWTYEEIDEVPGAGISLERQSYSLPDYDAAPGMYYYRLRQVGISGEESFSPVVQVNHELALPLTLAGIASTTTDLELEVVTEDPSNLTLQLYNLMGQEILTKNGAPNQGYNRILLPTGNIQSGIYILKMAQSGEVQARKIYLR